jgi:hypothetical protein
MRLEPDRDQAAAEQRGITRIARAVLARIGFSDIDADLMCHPGLIAVVGDVQRLSADATAAHRAAAIGAVRAALAGAELSRQRAHHLDCPAWAIDLSPGQRHLCAGLERALAQIPARPNRVIDVRVADWADAERAVFRGAAALLAESWPQMLAELTVCIRQVALLRGYGITGFSDFAVQGAVFVNAERCETRDGLPSTLRLAENLVHEGTHTRCYSAALDEPFLGAGRAGVQVATPLRADPRPLFGLFQQLVVLCRCAELYGRVASNIGAHAPAQARTALTRKVTLVEQARQALSTLRNHAGKLTDHGRAILRESSAAIAAEAATTR